MGQQIIRQPDGKYCIFNSITDSITHKDLSQDGVTELFIEQAKKGITEEVQGIIDQLESGGRPYYQFTMSFEEAKKMSEGKSPLRGEHLCNLCGENIVSWDGAICSACEAGLGFVDELPG